MENQIANLFVLKPPKSTDEYLRRKITASTNKYIAIQQVTDVWKDIEMTVLSTSETEINNQMLSDLISMHMRLVNLNKLLKKETPEIQKVCLKAGSTI